MENNNKRYIAHLKQATVGCGHNIACGETLNEINAQSLSEAQSELIKIINEQYKGDEVRLEKAVLYEVNECISLDMGAFYKDLLKKYEEKK